ncbi:methyltransferase [Streptosporangium fragile]|uniref:Methyltransferase n=1 Tax=Streptosporangium fragile TaxID=46186 RepID=A0ABN3WAU4_9ACTN
MSVQALRDAVTGYRRSQVIYVAAKLGLADMLTETPLTAKEMAARCGADPDVLLRVARVLAAEGVLRDAGEDRFGLGPLGEHLRTDAPGGVAAWTVSVCEEQYAAWGHALHTVRTGEPAFEAAFGMGMWSYLAGNEGAATTFAAAMADSVRESCALVADRYDLAGVERFVDVGGGSGALTTTLLRRHPGVRATLVELPETAGHARRAIDEAGLADRCEVVPGDFMERVPAGGDLYILCRVLADWPDAAAARILATCRAAMRPGARLLVVGGLARAGDGTARGLLDLHLLMMLGGRERDEDEHAALLSAAGFEPRPAVHAEDGRTSMIEAVAV